MGMETLSKQTTKLAHSPSNEEVKSATSQLVEANSEGVETCDNLDLLIKAAEEVKKTVGKFRGKANYARSLLMDIALKL